MGLETAWQYISTVTTEPFYALLGGNLGGDNSEAERRYAQRQAASVDPLAAVDDLERRSAAGDSAPGLGAYQGAVGEAMESGRGAVAAGAAGGSLAPGVGPVIGGVLAGKDIATGDYGGAASNIAGGLAAGALRSVKGAGKVAREIEGVPQPRGGTYVLRDGVTGEVMRTGRSNDLNRRRMEHARHPEFGKYDFEPQHRTDVYSEQRGLEQGLHEKYSPPLNKRSPIYKFNPNRKKYLDAAREFESQNAP